MDKLTRNERSQRMSLIRSRDTRPELAVRRIVHAMGYRYRLHGEDLPGSPDLVFASRRKVIFVHGCFWHRHAGCRLAQTPQSRLDYWGSKLASNRKRDMRNQRQLRQKGWRLFVVWECQLRNQDRLMGKINRFLDG